MVWHPFRRPAPIVEERVAPSFAIPKMPRQTARRSFNAASIDSLLADMMPNLQSGNAALRPSLRIMRGRSRHLAENNDYMRSFLMRVRDKVLGANGMRLIVRAMKDATTVDQADSAYLEKEFSAWAKKGNCTVCGRYSFTEVQRLVLTTQARDGEILVRMVRGFKNRWGFALQLLESDHLDENLNVACGAGAMMGVAIPFDNEIRMGVERDRWKRVVAYWIRTTNPADDLSAMIGITQYTRVPADEFLHVFIPDRADDARGAPWAWTAIRRLQIMGGYEEAELVAARLGANKGGFYKEMTDSALEEAATGLTTDGELLRESTPGEFGVLPPGVDFVPYNPDHPNSGFDTFIKSMLRGVAAGIGVSYNGLARDLEGVNFSSMRAGELDERDMWRFLQGRLREELCEPVYSAWLDMSLLTGALNLPPSKRDKFDADVWKGRGWPWVDPQKDITAAAQAVDLGTLTLTQILADQGLDIEDVFRERAAELKMAEQYKVPLGTGAPKLAPQAPADAGESEPAASPAKDA
jgi:lambda family phage portal protein